jgi:hypothetical protein
MAQSTLTNRSRLAKAIMASYVDEQKRDDGIEDDKPEPVDLDSLTPQQRELSDSYIDTYRRIMVDEQVQQQLLNIDGTAGCGKIYVIKAVCQKLRRIAIEHGHPDPIFVIAPSGVAALNIFGRTIHSALLIGAPSNPGSGSTVFARKEKL